MNSINSAETRQSHFVAALKEIKGLVDKETKPQVISDHDLNKLVRKLRREMSVVPNNQ